ncbi:plastocyanin/azurin family copper-binding protein [Pseudomonas sp. LS1212]|uniref:cupredoxin domain-containing protein n=1 Tax=Pseudomonas sp. LS1212 TaxID=2972478 RepID=UPI00215CC343|nr:plastocyanin/azurin family copper-binding protein [Pseudomonas sp. LS1212]UVJ41908.1 plastocyanin/azurin family copper-binding protein [Pseudomonas sp. LS1212]
MKAKPAFLLLVSSLMFSASAAIASPNYVNVDIGQPGNAQKVDRTIELKMGDSFFEPKSIDVKPGETIRFVLKNEGALLHEFSLGMAAAHAAHQKVMAAMFQKGTLSPTGTHDMNNTGHAMGGEVSKEHDNPNSVLIEPGATEELVWTFAKATGLEFACNLPGHYQSGMVGKVNIR